MASKAAASASDTHTRAVASQSTSVLAKKDTGIGGFFRAAGHHDSAAADKAADGGKSGSKSLDPGKPKPSFGGGKLRSAARKAKGVGMLQRTVTDLAESGADDFEQYGSLAGPPGWPEATDLHATSCVLSWEPPRHTGGRGMKVIGHHITVQFAGDGGFFVHTPDTESDKPQCMLEGLRPDTWHEFQVAAITASGVGALSRPSRPALTPVAPAVRRSGAQTSGQQSPACSATPTRPGPNLDSCTATSKRRRSRCRRRAPPSPCAAPRAPFHRRRRRRAFTGGSELHVLHPRLICPTPAAAQEKRDRLMRMAADSAGGAQPSPEGPGLSCFGVAAAAPRAKLLDREEKGGRRELARVQRAIEALQEKAAEQARPRPRSPHDLRAEG